MISKLSKVTFGFLFASLTVNAEQPNAGASWIYARSDNIECLSTYTADVANDFVKGSEAFKAAIDSIWPEDLKPIARPKIRMVVYDADIDILSGSKVLPFQPGTYPTAFSSDGELTFVARYVMSEKLKMERMFGRRQRGPIVFAQQTHFPASTYLDTALQYISHMPQWVVVGLGLLVKSSTRGSLSAALGPDGANELAILDLETQLKTMSAASFFEYTPLTNPAWVGATDRMWATRAAQLCYWGIFQGGKARKRLFWRFVRSADPAEDVSQKFSSVFGINPGDVWREVATTEIPNDPLQVAYPDLLERWRPRHNHTFRQATVVEQGRIAGECMRLYAETFDTQERYLRLQLARRALESASVTNNDDPDLLLSIAKVQDGISNGSSTDEILLKCVELGSGNSARVKLAMKRYRGYTAEKSELSKHEVDDVVKILYPAISTPPYFLNASRLILETWIKSTEAPSAADWKEIDSAANLFRFDEDLKKQRSWLQHKHGKRS